LLSVTRLAHLRWGAVPGSCRAPLSCARHRPCRPPDFRRVARFGERPVQSRGLTRNIHPLCASPLTGKLQQHRASVGVDFRALIRRRVRSQITGFIPRPGRCSPDLFPSEVSQLDRWAFALPSSASDRGFSAFQRLLPSSGGPGCRSDRAWKRLRRAPPTPCGFFTSLPNRVTFAFDGEPKAIRPCLACARQVRSDLVVPRRRPATVKQLAQPS
jgi:hypothetical protein